MFVYTDCGTRAPLPKEQQDPAYQHDGVPLPRAQLMGILNRLPGGQATQTSQVRHAFHSPAYHPWPISFTTNKAEKSTVLQATAHAPATFSSGPPPLGTGGVQLGAGNAGIVDSAKYKRV